MLQRFQKATFKFFLLNMRCMLLFASRIFQNIIERVNFSLYIEYKRILKIGLGKVPLTERRFSKINGSVR